MTFDPTKPVQTRDGRKARIICTDCKNKNFPIVALVMYDNVNESIIYLTKNGKYLLKENSIHINDLINIPENNYILTFNDESCSNLVNKEYINSVTQMKILNIKSIIEIDSNHKFINQYTLDEFLALTE